MVRVIFKDKKDGKLKSLIVKTEADAEQFREICRTGRNLRSRFEVVKIEVKVEDDLR